jgi:hypothetical protein
MHCSRCSEPFDCAEVYVWAEFHHEVNFGLATLCEACWQEVQTGLRALLTPHVWAERSRSANDTNAVPLPAQPAFASSAPLEPQHS